MLITNLLDEDVYPAEELIILYHERWEEELVFDEQKTHQDPRRATKPAQLRSETPAGVMQEIYALSLGHFVIRSLMFEAAATVGPRSGSAVVHRVLPDPASAACRNATARPRRRSSSGMQALLWEMQAERTETAAPQPDQPACDQAEDVEMEEETPRASAPSALEENLSGDSGYASLNGIVPNPSFRAPGAGG